VVVKNRLFMEVHQNGVVWRTLSAGDAERVRCVLTLLTQL
jgi:hypothetical protein